MTVRVELVDGLRRWSARSIARASHDLQDAFGHDSPPIAHRRPEPPQKQRLSGGPRVRRVRSRGLGSDMQGEDALDHRVDA